MTRGCLSSSLPSTRRTAEVARSFGVKTVSGPMGRARQMNAGAAAAQGRALLFLHADTRPPPRFDLLVQEALDTGAAGGAFSVSFDEDSPFLRFITGTTNFRARRMGVIFGDQGIFVGADTFRVAGGFPEQPIMEDYELVRTLRRKGEFRVLDEAVVTSTRKWKAVGAVRNSMVNVIITWAYLLGVSPLRLQGWYRTLIGKGGGR
jgi:rSAM/selenodomain-associated transferase 2